MRPLFFFCTLITCLFSSCSSTTNSNQATTRSASFHTLSSLEANNSGETRSNLPTRAARAQAIANEPLGNYWIGRRYHVDRLRFWGYIRRPRQSWDEAQLVMMDESRISTPDRLPERGQGRKHGFDNNYEYRIEGSFSSKTGYDPITNLALPVFRPSSFRVLNRNPGWLFNPGETYNLYEITLQPSTGIQTRLR